MLTWGVDRVCKIQSNKKNTQEKHLLTCEPFLLNEYFFKSQNLRLESVFNFLVNLDKTHIKPR